MPAQERSGALVEDEKGQGEKSDTVASAPDAAPPVQAEQPPVQQGTDAPGSPHGAEHGRQDGQNGPRGFLRRLTVNEWLTFLVGLGSLVVSYLTYKNATDTSDLKDAVAGLTKLAGEAHNQTAALRAQADAASLAVAETRKQVEAAFVQVEVARQAITASERPWVRVDVSIDEPVRTNLNGIRFPFRFALKNVGNSPAMLVAAHIAVVPRAPGADLLAEQRKLCEPLRAGDTPRANEGPSQFPGQEFALGAADYVYWRDVDEWTTPAGRPGAVVAYVSPAVAGCITYRFASGDTRQHQTGFVFSIYKSLPGRPVGLGPIEVGFSDLAGRSALSIPPGEMSLVPHLGSGAGFYAD